MTTSKKAVTPAKSVKKATSPATTSVKKVAATTKKSTTSTIKNVKASTSKTSNEVNDILGSLLYTGVGLAKNATQNVEQRVKEMLKNTKPAEKEGKVIIEKFVNNALDVRSQYEEKFNKVIEDAMKVFTLPKNNELSKLKKRINELENELSVDQAKSTYAKTSKTVKRVTNQLESKATAVAEELQDAAESIGKTAVKAAVNIAKKIQK